MNGKALTSHSPSETRRAGMQLAGTLGDRAVVALHGELGSGKTCFVRGMAQHLGIKRPVTSPTFALVHEFQGRRPLFHIDLYRLSGPQDVFSLGITDYLGRGIVAIEWAERAGEYLPPDTIHVRIEAGNVPDERRIRISRPGSTTT